MNGFRLQRFGLTTLVALVGCYLLLVLAVYVWQRKLLYFPSRGSPAEMAGRARSELLEPWTNAAGSCIGWRRESTRRPSTGTVLVLHGNAGCAVHRASYADLLQRAANVEVCILEYPGYGARSGEPTEKSLFAAADEAVASLAAGPRLFLVGESLGTGVACYLAGAHPELVAGVLLVAPYDSLVNVARTHYPWLPAGLILKDRFDSVGNLGRYRGPIYVWVGGRDVVVPMRFGQRLHDGYAGAKRLWVAAEAGHEGFGGEGPEWWRDVFDFWLTGGKGVARPR